MTDSHDETVPRRMNDPTDKEKSVLQGKRFVGADVYYDCYCWRGWLIFPVGFVLPTPVTSILGMSVLLSRSEARISIAMVPTAATIRLVIYSQLYSSLCVWSRYLGAYYAFSFLQIAQPDRICTSQEITFDPFYFFSFSISYCSLVI